MEPCCQMNSGREEKRCRYLTLQLLCRTFLPVTTSFNSLMKVVLYISKLCNSDFSLLWKAFSLELHCNVSDKWNKSIYCDETTPKTYLPHLDFFYVSGKKGGRAIRHLKSTIKFAFRGNSQTNSTGLGI